MAKRMLDRLRDNGVKTCPAPRHALVIVDALISKNGMGKLLEDAAYEADHMAESLESLIASLWFFSWSWRSQSSDLV